MKAGYATRRTYTWETAPESVENYYREIAREQLRKERDMTTNKTYKPGTPVSHDEDDILDEDKNKPSSYPAATPDHKRGAGPGIAPDAEGKAVPVSNEGPPAVNPRASASNPRFVLNNPRQGLPEAKEGGEPAPELAMVDGLPLHDPAQSFTPPAVEPSNMKGEPPKTEPPKTEPAKNAY